MSTSKFVKAKELPSVAGISPAFGYKMMKAGRFPQSVNLNPDPKGKPVTRWLRDEVEEWVEDRLSA